MLFIMIDKFCYFVESLRKCASIQRSEEEVGEHERLVRANSLELSLSEATNSVISPTVENIISVI